MVCAAGAFPDARTWGEPPVYLLAARDDARLHFRRAASPAEIRSNAPREAAELQRRGVPLKRDPTTLSYGMREFDVLDPDGHVLCFASPAPG